jgi:tight adherence protein B
LAAVFSLALGIGAPLVVLTRLSDRRRAKMQQQFPVALDVFVRGLRAGHPVSAALDLLTTEMQDPIGSEFGIVVDEVNYGVDLRDSLQNMANRWDMDDMQMFVVSLSIQSETGGNLAETLNNLSEVLRGRRQLKRKVKALSSEAKASSYIIGSLPFIMALMIYLVNADYIVGLFLDPRGKMMIGFGLGMIAAGVGVMYRMVKFEI